MGRLRERDCWGEVRCILGFVGESEGMSLLGRGEMYKGFFWEGI